MMCCPQYFVLHYSDSVIINTLQDDHLMINHYKIPLKMQSAEMMHLFHHLGVSFTEFDA